MAPAGLVQDQATFFGGKVLFPSGGVLDGYALAAARLSFALLQRTGVPVYVLIPIGAAAGMVWRLAR
jgi:hypothetical protein